MWDYLNLITSNLFISSHRVTSYNNNGIVKASLATVIPDADVNKQDANVKDLETKSIQLNLRPINSQNDSENICELGTKRVSPETIQSIRNSGNHVNFKFDDKSNSNVKTHLPGKETKKPLPPKQVPSNYYIQTGWQDFREWYFTLHIQSIIICSPHYKNMKHRHCFFLSQLIFHSDLLKENRVMNLWNWSYLCVFQGDKHRSLLSVVNLILSQFFPSGKSCHTLWSHWCPLQDQIWLSWAQ